MRYIIFPFFDKKKHSFLLDMWLFRTVVVVFISIFIISMPSIWLAKVTDVFKNCEKNVIPLSQSNIYQWSESITWCNNLARSAWTWPGTVGDSVLIPIIIFYLVQLIFFKVVINYIVLGGKNI